jgi:hypothetical protein
MREGLTSISPPATEETKVNKQKRTPLNSRRPKQKLPRGWDEARVRRVLEHYENQTEDEALAEDEAAFNAKGQTVMIVPTELVPRIREMIARCGA